MILDISALFSSQNKEETREVHLELTSFVSRLGDYPIIKKEPFELHVSNVENKRLLIQGELDVTIAIPCDRCLREVPTEFHLVIDKECPIGENLKAEEDDTLEQSGYLDGYQIDVDRLVYGEILVAWPVKVLCRDDCKGICNVCGANRNEVSCSCDRTAPDPRMAAFQDVFNKFKEV